MKITDMDTSNKKAIIAMSGGVDSSVAALLSVEAGFECIGATMKLFDNEDVAEDGSAAAACPPQPLGDTDDSRSCCSLRDADDASRVCGMIGIPFYVFDFSEDFRRDVIGRFVEEYAAGRTPNPCIDCNRYLKYDRLFRRMEGLGFDCVVTGHYARIERDAASGRWLLKKAVDETKDQSYVLYSLTQEQLAHTSFPLGAYRKSEVRELAAAHGFLNARKRDSQDICFVRHGDYAQFIESYTGREWPRGDFVDTGGAVLGRHDGIIRYTIGQRKGIAKAVGRPMYVVGIRPDTNEVVLGESEELYSRKVTAQDVNLIATDSLPHPTRVTAKIRYNQKDSPATAVQTGEGEVEIIFDEPQRAVTKGQAVVMYDNEVVIGGGTIT
ncbi:MAG: tRNA 2-thiouridine(34) synthase MnmA [Clostridiales Family XIII bacterium]|jgi:tRNA-specific 2-thiouridylase|nr:tRNA 2-thiouridine(34) synthase MnmA [Clostridiales Family XIII bacterium]